MRFGSTFVARRMQYLRLEAALRETQPGTGEYPKLMRLHRQTAMLAAFLATKLRLVPSSKVDKKAPTEATPRSWPDRRLHAMPPLSFTDEGLNSITALASPLPVEARGDFLRLVADRLSGYPEQVRGAALVYRIAQTAQRDFLAVGRPFRLARGGKWR